MPKPCLKLYIAGTTVHSQRAVQNLRKICEEIVESGCEVDIIDVLLYPDRAEEDKIIATPTLIRASPPPVRRVIGDLTDISRVIAILGLNAASEL